MTAEPLISQPETSHSNWLDKVVVPWWPALTVEKLLIVLIILLTLFTRFYDVGARTMAHDEINHVVPAYTLENYVYDPVTHGPFQFHALALSYFFLGDSDFSSRVPAALFGVAVVLFTIFAWRRYLGRLGALIAAFLFLISPYILFYSRYTRNEIFIVFWGLVMLWLFLRYLEDGKNKWLLWLTLITALHYADKATSFIFSAEALIFLALLFIFEILRQPWLSAKHKSLFQVFVLITLFSLMLTAGFYMLGRTPAAEVSPVDPSLPASENYLINSSLPLIISAGLALILAVAAIVTLIKGFGWEKIRRMRSFDLIALQFLLILPLLTALPVKLLGFDPTDYTQNGIIRSAVAFSLLTTISVLLGLLWDRKIYLKCMAIFWSIFIVLYTTFFMHGEGFFKGIVGALGYWMSQQSVERGTQPLYYYALVQIPMYEYLPALGTILALLIGIKKRLFLSQTDLPFAAPVQISLAHQASIEEDSLPEVPYYPEEPALADEFPDDEELIEVTQTSTGRLGLNWPAIFTDRPIDTAKSVFLPTLVLLLYWSVMSLLAFTVAGERMPWLTTHITMPLILTSGWALGYLAEKINWQEIRQHKGLLLLFLTVVFILAFNSLLGTLLGTTPPFQGKELAQLQATSTFLLAALGTLGSLLGLLYLMKGWIGSTFLKFALLAFFGLLALFTARTAYRAAFINYDNAKELLVYAHSTRDMKDTVEQIETISKRLYGDKTIKVAYDNDVRYPYWWYMRDYPNKNDFDSNVTRTLEDYPIIVVGASNFSRIEPIVEYDYYQYDYKRMWWPNEQLYRDWTLSKVLADLSDPAKRSALWQLWFNRDYKEYAQAFNNPSLTLATWSPSDTARMFIKKDVVARIWEFGVSPEPEEPKVDPYAGGTISLEPQRVISVAGDLIFNAPRSIATAPDGSLYVADSRNHRIVHLDQNGLFIEDWGTYGNVLDGNIPGGLFNEPWGVAVGPDGLIYVADTWNHRIQVFTANGQFLRMWSSFEVNGMVDGFWGPRGIVVDNNSRVFVTDTGKQRVVIFSSEGDYLTQFGGVGISAGQLDEPVGIALAEDGRVFIADTWNYRIQVFTPDLSGMNYTSLLTWDVDAWRSDSLDNKPFIALDRNNQVYVTDPDRGRIIRFDDQGQFLQLWGGYDNAYLMGIISGVAAAQDGGIWVSDAMSNTLLLFYPPALPAALPGLQNQ